MPRPSRSLDRVLLAAGRALLPEVGCAGLTIRQVAEAARVNIGMFHYHFKTREAFLRAVMQETYEEMYGGLALAALRPSDLAPAALLRAALRTLGRFARDNRKFIARVLADALGGERCARDFLKENLPRHVTVLLGLIAEGQARGELKPMPPTQALAVCAGSLVMPILVGGSFIDSGEMSRASARALGNALLTDAAIDQRIELALEALRAPARPAARRPTRTTKGKP